MFSRPPRGGSGKYEEYAYVLDFLPQGHPLETTPIFRREPIAQVIGENYFTLLEVVPKPGIFLAPRERVFIGKGLRDKIARVKRRISYNDLTIQARDELPAILEKIVTQQEKRFVEFFNNSGSITTRLHSLQLLPGIGRKYLWVILENRRKKPFESFEDIKERIKISDPKKLIIKRIISELKGEDKYKLFVK
ncbi:MAG: DUF655 domain-containing protein [archaeon GB-1867-097]|nr:DUF655 domain-containing protein [Candidatus Verstraetearchaeota archaeon]MCS7373807.1 DUF655 domain-containing protein [Candidatus Culexmicrobium thermophilum]MCS7384363.1 DUF655 domain-containing protein [Candidatus Culexmicrobium thermophilum]HDO20922.1 DUF655 domain-containing protein [Candidatus Bathyarchaeota archaeon]